MNARPLIGSLLLHLKTFDNFPVFGIKLSLYHDVKVSRRVLPNFLPTEISKNVIQGSSHTFKIGGMFS